MRSSTQNRNYSKIKKRKLKITLEVLNEVTAKFPESIEFMEKRLEQKCLKEKISVEEVIYIFTKT